MDKNIGQEIKKIRKKQGLTLKTVAESTGYSISFISQLERGKSSATLESIKKIAVALQVNPSRFFEEHPIQAEGISDVRKNTSMDIGIRYEDLGPNMSFKEFVPMLVTLPSGETEGSPIVHEGQEFVYVLEGKLTVLVGDVYHELLPGEKIMYESTTSHYWFNYGETEARFLCVSTGV